MLPHLLALLTHSTTLLLVGTVFLFSPRLTDGPSQRCTSTLTPMALELRLPVFPRQSERNVLLLPRNGWLPINSRDSSVNLVLDRTMHAFLPFMAHSAPFRELEVLGSAQLIGLLVHGGAV